MKGQERWAALGWILLGSPLIALVAISAIALLFSTTPQELWAQLHQEGTREAIGVSLKTTAVALVAVGLFGTFFALAIHRAAPWLSSTLEVIATIPAIMPPSVAGLALLLAFGRQGVFGPWLEGMGISIAFTPIAVVMAQVFVSTPFFVREASNAFKSIAVCPSWNSIGSRSSRSRLCSLESPLKCHGLPRRVTSIREAITFLGFKAVRQLAMTVGVFELFLGKTDTESLRRRAWWRQSVDTGVCARWLASQTTAVSPEESYTCGLLHYVGKTLLDHSSPDKYEFCLAALNAGHDDRSAERIAYGCDHVEVAVAVAEKWGFPEVLTEGLNYVDPPEREDPHRAIRACTCISHHIAQLAIKGKAQIASEDEERALPVWALEALNLPVSKTDFLILEGSAAIRAHAQLAL